MPLKQGTKLGPYEVVSAIGAGGMGEVYRAATPGWPATSRSRCCRSPLLATPRDGQRFLVNRYVQPDRVTPLTIVLNATGEEAK